MSAEPQQTSTVVDGTLYLVRFLQVHESFRRPELDALARVTGVKYEIVDYRDGSPFCIVKLESDAAAAALVRRSVLCTGIWTLWGYAPNYHDLEHYILTTETTLALLDKHRHSSFRFDVDCFQGKRSDSSRRELMESLAYLALQGPIAMRNPDLQFTIFEEYALLPAPPISREVVTIPTAPCDTKPKSKSPARVYLGTFVGASDRDAVSVYDLKRRTYISTTSMDANLALITANLALAAPGKLAYDPFMGTGGFPLACAHFGAHVMGSDIDGRSVRGQGKKPGGKGAASEKSVLGNFKQYGTQSRYLDGFIGDLTNTPLRVPGIGTRGEDARWLDAVVCDPPYGVREGLKTLGSVKLGQGSEPVRLADGQLAHLSPDYIPPKRPYSFDALQLDVLNFAVRTMVDGGRLCMWLPTANEPDCETEDGSTTTTTSEAKHKQAQGRSSGSEAQSRPTTGHRGMKIQSRIPTHPGLELISVCVQDFSKWSRKLLTYERRAGRFEDVRLDDSAFRVQTQESPVTSPGPGSQSCSQQAQNGATSIEISPSAAADSRIAADLGSTRLSPGLNEGPADGHVPGTGPATTGGQMRGRADELNAFRKQYFQGFR